MAEIRDAEVSRSLAGLLGELHQIDMPLVKEPIWLYHTIERLVGHHWPFQRDKIPFLSSLFSARHLTDLPVDLSKFPSDSDRTIFDELRSVCNFPKEFEDLKWDHRPWTMNANDRLLSRTLLSTVDSQVCFTHNDFQPGNILRVKSETDNFTVIDFEYCSYNYR